MDKYVLSSLHPSSKYIREGLPNKISGVRSKNVDLAANKNLGPKSEVWLGFDFIGGKYEDTQNLTLSPRPNPNPSQDSALDSTRNQTWIRV
jgi:hypothetical protein